MNSKEITSTSSSKLPHDRGILSKAGEQTLIDISMPIHEGMLTFPGNPEFSIERVDDIRKGDPANVSELKMSSHLGTHVDAPKHFSEEGAGAEALSLTKLIGPARVLEITGDSVTTEELRHHDVKSGERLLFRTKNSERRLLEDRKFHEDFVTIDDEAAVYLAELGVLLIGVDYLTVESPEEKTNEAFHVHHRLLGRGMIIVEGLNLADVEAGDYELLCLPLRIFESDGAPARAVLRKLSS